MAAPTARRRSKALLPTCYYEGYLEKRSPKETTSCRLWTCLCGNTLFFYNNTKDCEYTEKLELSGFISLADDSSRGSNLTGARFSLRMKDGEVKLTASSLEARVLWKGFILSVVELAVPSSLNLLPGQLHMLAEVIEKEKARRKPPPLPQGPVPSPYLPLLANMPPCYHPVSRLEAEMFLERNQEFGNFLLRPGRDGTSLAVTTYQDLNGRPVFRHYRVARKPDGGFSLDVENPIPCATLHDVIDLLVERTSGALRPLILEESYDENITFVHSNAENGERNLQCASGRPSRPAPVPPPKPGHHPAGQSVRSMDREVNFEDNTYVNYSSGDEDESSVARSPTPPPSTGKRALFPKLPSSVSPYEEQISGTSGDAEDENFTTLPPQTVKKAMLPKVPSSVSLSRYEEQSTSTSADSQVLGRPVPPPRTSAPTKAPTNVRRRSLPSDHFTAAITDELKEKLEMRRAKCDEQRDSAN
ncbi:signal-transducing adaptor protein 2-like isoform X1 [Anguilla anguilla]|uniref:signal-transducing adaptor protein 2-like isoform X1 n=1 Tax=Anguilla anguilla TaxID=7936 RepID=UPI0015AE2C51|nr:signal-transducing adaptor protein 2-like isoform X1 [Anguilla anguilla]